MVFSDTTNKTGIIQEIERFLNLPDATISGTSTTLKEFTARINNNLDIVVGHILEADNRWQWDDSNLTTQPVGTTNLVSSQASYRFDGTWLRVSRVEIKDSAGNWLLLTPIDIQDSNVAMGALQTTTGTPIYYDVSDDTVTLYPATNYNSTGGLKVYFQREPDYFATTDTTQEPGFPSPYHRLLTYGTALDWCIEKQLVGKINTFKPLYDQLLIGLKKNLSERNAVEKPVIRTKYNYPR